MKCLLLMIPLFALGGCAGFVPVGPSPELQAAYDAKAQEVEALYGRISSLQARMTEEGATPETLAESAVLLSEATMQMMGAYQELGALTEQASAESGTPEWLLILEAVAASVFGIRMFRGPASKGAFKSLPILGSN